MESGLFKNNNGKEIPIREGIIRARKNRCNLTDLFAYVTIYRIKKAIKIIEKNKDNTI
ncbi:MAG: hypothetical protein HUJ68_06910 [Clostridia bacterium]|nr:hypothetical protein [Clostridia bacterium]